jgi:hypothetical protein
VLTSRMSLLGVNGLSAYFMPQGVSSVYGIGLGWTLCMCVWWAVFVLGKCIEMGKRHVERRDEAVGAASVVFCR